MGSLLAIPDVSTPQHGAHTVEAVRRLNDFGPKGGEDLAVVPIPIGRHGKRARCDWWLSHPSEKYEKSVGMMTFQISGDDDIPNIWG